MTAHIAKARLISTPISFACFGLHFLASGANPEAIEEWVCFNDPGYVAQLHIALSKSQRPVAEAPMTTDEWKIAQRCVRECLRINAKLEAV